jgi:hypothetical protein
VSRSIDFWVKLAQTVQGFSTPVIAVLLGVITVLIQRRQAKTHERQAQTQHLQHSLALLDRRMKVFNATQEFITLVLRGARMDKLEPLFQFAHDTREHHLLFGSEVGAYLDKLCRRGAELNEIHELSQPDNIVPPEQIDRKARLVEWFSYQPAKAKDVFLKYIDFREP